MARSESAAIGFVMLAFLAAPLSAQTRPDLSGLWRLDPNASRMIGGAVAADSATDQQMTWTVAHRDPEISVLIEVRDSHGSHQWSFMCTTDGRVCVNELPDLKEIRRISAVWQDDTLVTTQTAETPHGTFEARDRIFLSPSGDRLTFERTVRDARGERSVKQVFRKIGPPPQRSSATNTLADLTRVLRDSVPENQPVERDLLAQRQADAAVSLLRLGQYDTVWPLLRHMRDQSLRTYLIHRLPAAGLDLAVGWRHLNAERDGSIRRALILSLGGFTEEQLPLARRQLFVPVLLRWYRDDPDPGVHASIDWLLRYDAQGDRPRALNWNQYDALVAIDRELAGDPPERRGWYVNRELHTMVVFRGPVELRMGSPAYERGRTPASDSPDEPLNSVRISRSFAVASKEITVGQFRRFLEANPDVRRRHEYEGQPARMQEVLQRFSPEDGGPQIAVTWYEAAMYCNWLSKQEGIPESEWVYPTDPDSIRSGLTLPADYLKRTGYRLPTEAEWEYATRAGTTTPYFFGISDSLLHEYAWYAKRPQTSKGAPVDPRDPQRTWPVGQLKPNDFGLFDVYGNVWEWIHDRLRRYPSTPVLREDVEDTVLVVADSVSRVRRGGAFPYGSAALRSAGRGTVNAHPFTRRDNVGFRVARTLGSPR